MLDYFVFWLIKKLLQTTNLCPPIIKKKKEEKVLDIGGNKPLSSPWVNSKSSMPS